MFAELPSPTAGDLGTWLICFAAIAVVAERVKALFWPNTPASDQSVTRQEFAVLDTRMAADLTKLETSLSNYVSRSEIQRIEDGMTRLTDKHEELFKSTTLRNNELTKCMADLSLCMERMRGDLRTELSKLMDNEQPKLIALARLLKQQTRLLRKHIASTARKEDVQP